MTIWVDAQISPAIADWLERRFAMEARHVKDLGMLGSSDRAIFEAARIADVVVLTKDRDFIDLVKRRGCPPRIIWVTCGNTSNHEMMRILSATFVKACELLVDGEPVVEIK